MNVPILGELTRAARSALVIASLAVVAACATSPTSPPGAAEARGRLSALQADPNLASRAPLELSEAESAVGLAEQTLPPERSALGAHRVYLADRTIEIARAKAMGRYAFDQRADLVEQREQARLTARTREADRARSDADRARSDAKRARDDASRARDAASSARYAEARAVAGADAAQRDASAARSAEARARSEADERAADLERQIILLEAEITDRGLVLTLGDLLFATDRAILEPGADHYLDPLVDFLERFPGRQVEIEGHTDNVGAAGYNLGLSQRRAESVRESLIQRGIGPGRFTIRGFGQGRPIASNLTAAGRQQNRRVEIIVENPPVVAGR